jgi:hypothetical protein
VTPEPESPDEARLKQLFDASAARPSGPVLTKLRARAAEVPDRAPRAPRWLPRWAWSPLLGGLAVGAGALAVTIGVSLDRQPEAGPSPEVVTHAPVQAPAPSALAASPSSTPSQDDVADDVFDEGAELAEFDLGVDDPYLDVDALDDPAEDDLDAWWEATADLVEGGG